MLRILARTASTLCLWLLACTSISETATATDTGGGKADAGPSALSLYLESRAIPGDSTAVYSPFVAVFPFEDDSDFPDDIWDLENDLARLLTVEMSTGTRWRVVPHAAVIDALEKGEQRAADDERIYAAAHLLLADIALIGTLLDFDMERAGDQLVGGYESYRGIAEIDLRVIRVADRATLGRLYSKRDRTDTGLGLNLPGNPRGRDEQFAGLRDMTFGSPEFRATGIGQVTMAVVAELMEKLARTLRPKGIRLPEGPVEVLSVYGDEIFINIGSENGVYRGQRFEVLTASATADSENPDAATRLTVVQIQDIIGGRVSKVKALSAPERIAAGDVLRLVGADDGEESEQ